MKKNDNKSLTLGVDALVVVAPDLQSGGVRVCPADSQDHVSA